MLARIASTFQSGLNSAVAATRDGVNRVLPGNPALRDYDVLEQVGTGGTNGVWDIYNAIKKTGKSNCTVWIFDKARHLNGFDKVMKENVLNILKHGVLSLCRLQHPRILSVERRLEESAYSLVFVTERINGTLDYLLSKREVETDSSSGLFDVELRYGLLQICEALSFLHDSAKLYHCNLTPFSISVSDKGCWKLAGMEFTRRMDDDNFKWSDNYPTMAQPCPSYIPPDLFENKIIDKSSDAFAYGVLLYRCYTGQTIVDCSCYDAARVLPRERAKYNAPPLLHRLPTEVRDHFKMLTSSQRDIRPTVDQLRSISFFQSAGALTLHYLDTLLQRPQKEKEQFFMDLPAVLDGLPSRVRNGIVVNSLKPEFANVQILPFLLPPVFKIVELASGMEFYEKILPVIKDLFNTQSAKACSLMIENLPLMLQKLTEAKKPDEVKNYLLPLLGRALAQEKQSNLQAKSLEVIPQLAEHLDEASIKSNLIPKVKSAALSDSCSGPVKVSILVAIGKLLPRLDRWFVMDSILDWIPRMVERTPSVLVAVLGVYQVTLLDDKLGLTKEFIGNNALPILLPLSMDSSLTLTQFQHFMRVIRLMLDKIEQEQTNKLKSIGDHNTSPTGMDISLNSITKASSVPMSTISALPVSSPLVTTPTLTSTQGGLSLQQKEEEMRRLENKTYFHSQAALELKTPAPKDLTATLFEKNMSSISKPAPMTTNNSTFNNSFNALEITKPTNKFMGNNAYNFANFDNQPTVNGSTSLLSQYANQTNVSSKPASNGNDWAFQSSMVPMNAHSQHSRPAPTGARKLTASELAAFLN